MNRTIWSFLGSARGAWLTAGLLCVLLAWMSTGRAPIAQVWADEGTFLSMTASLALDGDLLFTEADLSRLDVSDPGRSALILQRGARGIAYSKPVVLPLLAVPWWALFGDLGLVLLNATALGLGLWLGQRYLTRLAWKWSLDRGERVDPGDHSGHVAWLLVTFVFAAVVVPYVFWRMADLLQLCFNLIGLVLCLAHVRGIAPSDVGGAMPGVRDRILDHRAAPWIGVILVALTTNMRLSNGALVLIPVLADALNRRWGRAVAKGMLAAATVALMATGTWLLTGAPEPYRAERTTFVPMTGYPAGSDAAQAMERFDIRPATHVNALGDAGRVAYSAVYFWLGRHTGLIFYFPAAVVFLGLAIRRSDRVTWACLAGAAVVLVFFIVWKPVNYFGGATFIGNRYFLSVYPAFLLAMARLPSWRALALAWLVAMTSYGSATLSIAQSKDFDQGSQNHTRAGLLRSLPYESTAHHLDGTRDQYWAGQFQRFVDRSAQVRGDHFELVAGRPDTGLMVAQWQDPGALRYIVQAEAPEATLVVTDWQLRKRRYAVGRDLAPGDGSVGIDLESFKAWRYHGFWFESRGFWSRVLNMRLEAPEGTTARLYHLGDPEQAAVAFNYERAPMDLPSRVEAGTRTTVILKARNMSGAFWRKGDVLEVTGRYRLWRDGELEVESGRFPIPRRIGGGELLELPMTVSWPAVPGTVKLELDLVLENIDWFQARLGGPVATAQVEVVEPGTGNSPSPRL